MTSRWRETRRGGKTGEEKETKRQRQKKKGGEDTIKTEQRTQDKTNKHNYFSTKVPRYINGEMEASSPSGA